LLAPIIITKMSNLSFGAFYIPFSGSTTATVRTDTTLSGSATTVGIQTRTAAVFAVSGTGNLLYTPSITVATGSAKGLAISAIQFKCSGQSDVPVTLSTLTTLSNCALVSNAASVYVGGTLTIGSTAVASSAQVVGSIDVTVAYN
jgi:hypothetical protein